MKTQQEWMKEFDAYEASLKSMTAQELQFAYELAFSKIRQGDLFKLPEVRAQGQVRYDAVVAEMVRRKS